MTQLIASEREIVRWLSSLDRLSEIVPIVSVDVINSLPYGYRTFGCIKGRLRYEQAIVDVVIGWVASRGIDSKWSVTIDDTTRMKPGLNSLQLSVVDSEGLPLSLQEEIFSDLSRELWQLLPAEEFVLEFLEQIQA